MNTSHLFSQIQTDIETLTALGDAQVREAITRIYPVLEPMLQQRITAYLVTLVATYNAQPGVAPLELRIDTDRIEIVPQAVANISEPIGELDARIALRIPSDLKDKVEQAAAAEGISTNSWIIRVLGAAVSTPAPVPSTFKFQVGSRVRGRGRS
jgi:hypothetical protein